MSNQYHDDDDEMRREYDTEDEEFERNPTEAGKWASLAIALLGLWLIVEPFLFEILAANFWNDIVVGALLVVVGGYNYYRRADEHLGSVGAAVFAALLGLWLIVSPWVYAVEIEAVNLTTEVGFWNDVIVGLLVLVLGVYSAYEARDTDARAAAVD